MALKSSVVLITGTSSGIGNACATFLAKKRFIVYGTSRNPEGRQHRADEFFTELKMDQTDSGSVGEAVGHVLAREGRIDVLVCGAGMSMAGAVEETPEAEIEREFDTNFLGLVRVVKAVLPSMRARGSGRIICISSLAGRSGIPFQAFYSASKHAIEGFAESLRYELRSFGLSVVILEPGHFRTRMASKRTKHHDGQASAYRLAMERSMGVVEREESNGPGVIVVARFVHKLMEKRDPKVRYAVGTGFERFAVTLRRLIPSRLYERMFGRFFKVGG